MTSLIGSIFCFTLSGLTLAPDSSYHLARIVAPSPRPLMDELPLFGARWGHWRWLLLLLTIAAGLRAWQITHTEVATRDSIAYTRYAWRLGSESFTKVARTSEHHPAYPVLVYLASIPVR